MLQDTHVLQHLARCAQQRTVGNTDTWESTGEAQPSLAAGTAAVVGKSGEQLGSNRKAAGLAPLLTLAIASLVFCYLHGGGVRTAELEKELRRAEKRGGVSKEVTIRMHFL